MIPSITVIRDRITVRPKKNTYKSRYHKSSDGVIPYQVQVQKSKLTRQEKIAELNEKWKQTKLLMTDKNRELNNKKIIIREMAETCTELLHVSDGRVGEVAVGLGGTLVSPPLSVDHVEHYFGEVKGFPAITELIDIMKNGVPVKTSVTNLDPSRVIRYGNHSTVLEHMDLV